MDTSSDRLERCGARANEYLGLNNKALLVVEDNRCVRYMLETHNCAFCARIGAHFFLHTSGKQRPSYTAGLLFLNGFTMSDSDMQDGCVAGQTKLGHKKAAFTVENTTVRYQLG